MIEKDRPQNRNLKPFGSGKLTPEEEAEYRRRSHAKSTEARKRNADIRAAVRAALNLNSKGRAKSKDMLKMVSIEELNNDDGAPMIAKLVYAQILLALQGDKEARDWVCKMAGADQLIAETVSGLTVTADAGAVAGAGGVRIHLIRGEKPHEEPTPDELATQAADRMAIVEAMRAIGEEEEASDGEK